MTHPNSIDTAPRPTAPRDFFRAFRDWWSAFGYMRKNRLRAFHLSGPALILVITLLGFRLSSWLTDVLRQAITRGLSYLGFDLSTPIEVSEVWWSDAVIWGASILDWMLEWGAVIAVLWLKIKLTKYLLLTLLAPVMSALAGAVRKKETGAVTPWSAVQVMRDLARGIRTAVVLLGVELLLSIILAVFSLLLTVFAAPVAFLLSPLLLAFGWMVGAYFYGAAIFDAVYEQAGLDWKSSIRTGWADRYRLLGIGAIFSLLLILPIVGVILAAFFGPMPCTVAAARMTYTPKS